MKYTILHNNRCSKSRLGIENIEASGKEVEVRYYLENPLNFDELVILQKKLWTKAIEFTRTGEGEFLEAELTRESSDEEILRAIEKYPKLLERPIVYNETEAVVGRPPENIINFMKKKV